VGIEEFMRSKDIASFRHVAIVQKLYILVRRTNKESIKYIGNPDYMAKPIDCKAKTADRVVLTRYGVVTCAGLVVNPTLPLFENAFNTSRKAGRAANAWEAFITDHPPASCEARDSQEVRTWPGAGPGYAVQMCTTSKHYGCVMHSTYPQGINGKYLHGDYDMFGIAPADAPQEVLRTSSPEEDNRMGAPHLRGPNTQSVQFSVNAISGLALIKHGEQELFADFDDEPLDVFCPDGAIRELPDAAAARHFYRTVLQGREVFTDPRPGTDVPARGLWRKRPGAG
jgi:hypothetical protein